MSGRNPILRTIKRQGWFDKPPVASTGCQLVVFPQRGSPYVVPVGAVMRNADFKSADITYEVATTPDTFTVEGTSESFDDVVRFEYRAVGTYQIQDPLKIIQRNISDSRADVQRLVGIAIAAVTRDCSIDRFSEAQRTVRRTVEGEEGSAAQRLNANGYLLQELSVTLLREKELRDMSRKDVLEREKSKLNEALREREVNREMNELSMQSLIEREKEKLETVKRENQANKVEHIQNYLSGDLVTRLSFFAAQGDEQLHKAIMDLSDIDKRRIEAVAGFEIRVLEEQMRELPAHKRKELFDEILNRQKRNFNKLTAGDTPPPNSSPSDSSPRSNPAEDEWDE